MQEGLWIRNYIPGTVLGFRDSAKQICSHGAYGLVMATDTQFHRCLLNCNCGKYQYFGKKSAECVVVVAGASAI